MEALVHGAAGAAVLHRRSAPNAAPPSPHPAAVRRLIPDIDERVEVALVGTPLTHERFLRRHRGTYGPGIKAGQGLFPWPATPVRGLYNCGDFSFPGGHGPCMLARAEE